jgi:hypothetical protein
MSALLAQVLKQKDREDRNPVYGTIPNPSGGQPDSRDL